MGSQYSVHQNTCLINLIDQSIEYLYILKEA